MQSVFEESLPRPSVDAVRGEMMPSGWLLQPVRCSGREATRVAFLLQVRNTWPQRPGRPCTCSAFLSRRVCLFTSRRRLRFVRPVGCCLTLPLVSSRRLSRWISGLRPSLSDCWELLPGDRRPSSPISTFSSPPNFRRMRRLQQQQWQENKKQQHLDWTLNEFWSLFWICT